MPKVGLGIRADSVFVCLWSSQLVLPQKAYLGSTPRQVTEIDIQRVIEASCPR